MVKPSELCYYLEFLKIALYPKFVIERQHILQKKTKTITRKINKKKNRKSLVKAELNDD